MSDDVSRESLSEIIESARAWHEARGAETLSFGANKVSSARYAESLQDLLARLPELSSNERLQHYIEERFDFYEVYGGSRVGEVKLTSYYEPVIRGSREATNDLSQALYRKPGDLLRVTLPAFEKCPPDRPLRGRLGQKGSESEIRPYFSRREIDEGGALAKRRLEIAYVDPVEAFFLQIQGSGTIEWDDGTKLRVGYSDQNGYPYTGIGKLVKEIPPEKLTLFHLETYLRSLADRERRELLYQNESYVFFREIDGEPVTSSTMPAVAGRTIATDGRFFPKGALALLVFDKPIFENPTDSEPVRWETVSRLVVDQDSGGAIRGTGRVDLFWGRGAFAKQSAGVIRGTARLSYLSPRQ